VLEAAVSPLPLVVARGFGPISIIILLGDRTLVSRSVAAMALSDIPEMALPANEMRSVFDQSFRL